MKIFSAVGRRKTSVAQVRLIPGKGTVKINKREINDFFPIEFQRVNALRPLELTNQLGKYDIHANIRGGGISGQMGAMQLAIARALVEIDEENRSELRSEGLLTRDPRMVERKKYGRKKARKRFQFSKR